MRKQPLVMEPFRTYDNIDSTNEEARRLLSTGVNYHGTALLAATQTNGKGQYGRTWHAESGCHLALTIIIQPTDRPALQLPQISMKMSLAVIRALHRAVPGLDAKIKWPNDIYVNAKKLGGILIENSLNATNVQYCIIGIGLNINEQSFPDDLPGAVSLFNISGKKHDVKQIAQQLYKEVMRTWNEPAENWKTEYDMFLYGKDENNSFLLGDTEIVAMVKGVDNEGRIILEKQNGKVKSYFSHEIKWMI